MAFFVLMDFAFKLVDFGSQSLFGLLPFVFLKQDQNEMIDDDIEGDDEDNDVTNQIINAAIPLIPDLGDDADED